MRLDFPGIGLIMKIGDDYDNPVNKFPNNTSDTGSITIHDRNLFFYGTVSDFQSDYVIITTDAVSPQTYAFNIKHSLMYRVDERTGDVMVWVPSKADIKADIKDTADFSTTPQHVIMHSRSGLTYASVPSIIIDR